MNRQEILNKFTKEEDRLLVSKLLDKIEFTIKRNSVEYTDFLDMRQRQLLEKVLKEIKYTNYVASVSYTHLEQLVKIFGEDLFEKKDLLKTFLELTGNGETKPFDCVGTFEEVNFAISKTIQNLDKEEKELPFLLKYYKENYQLVDTSQDITKRYNEENNLNEEQDDMLRK